MRYMVLACVVCAVITACGGSSSPTSPSPTPAPAPAPSPSPPAPTGIPTIAGTWSGLISFTFQSVPNKCLQTRVELTQTDRSIQGTWVVTAPAGNDIRGEISGTLNDETLVAQFSGTATWNSPQDGSSTARCIGRAVLGGSVTPSRLLWRTPRFTFDNCDDVGMSDLVWTLDPGPTTSRCTQ